MQNYYSRHKEPVSYVRPTHREEIYDSVLLNKYLLAVIQEYLPRYVTSVITLVMCWIKPVLLYVKLCSSAFFLQELIYSSYRLDQWLMSTSRLCVSH